MKSLIVRLGLDRVHPAAMLLLALMLVLAGCEAPGGATTNNPAGTGAGATMTPDSADKVKIGEKITIEITDVPNAPAPFVQVVREDGSVSLPLNNLSLVVAGKRKSEIVTEIHDLYVPRLFRRMTVNLKTEDRYFSVGGEVRQPGRLGYIGQVTIITAIQAAGDFTDFADKKRVTIIRADGKIEKVNVKRALEDPKYNVPVFPGDTIQVSRRLM